MNRVKEVQRQDSRRWGSGKCVQDGRTKEDKKIKKEVHGVHTKVKIQFIPRKGMGLVLRDWMETRETTGLGIRLKLT